MTTRKNALQWAFTDPARATTSLDAVNLAVRTLEHRALANAGRAAALAGGGTAELDAAVMDGKQQRAEAWCARRGKNLVYLGRRVMGGARHRLLVSTGPGA